MWRSWQSLHLHLPTFGGVIDLPLILGTSIIIIIYGHHMVILGDFLGKYSHSINVIIILSYNYNYTVIYYYHIIILLSYYYHKFGVNHANIHQPLAGNPVLSQPSLVPCKVRQLWPPPASCKAPKLSCSPSSGPCRTEPGPRAMGGLDPYSGPNVGKAVINHPPVITINRWYKPFPNGWLINPSWV